MRFWADECLSGAIVRRLRDDGHDVVWSAEIAVGEIDENVLVRAISDDRLLITRDQASGNSFFAAIEARSPSSEFFSRKMSTLMLSPGRSRVVSRRSVKPACAVASP